MDQERWRQISRLYHSALERPSHDREAFLQRECHEDEELRHEVRALLVRARSAENFLNEPVGALAAPIGAVTAAETSSRIGTPDALHGFTPGTVLAGRYRIVALVGSGGMGDVYRADDMKLGVPVALKFLPRALAGDPVRRERFLSEVRTARQISHPNVCRVFDLGESGGDPARQFLSMEYIDGEDLSSLLRRIGRLPADKALDIAHQICAGVAAAHECGVLHRDLKPSNVMLDARGRVHVTDFGLAVAVDAASLDGDMAGTPLYMAPEQFAGKGASVRSDVHALGLVLYELYTGKPAFAATSIAALRSQKEQQLPPPPSELIKDMDPSVERVIMWTLARDPRARPASVAQVAAALPGGNALEAALRAGETPSPQAVAAAGANEALEPWAAWALLALLVGGITTAVAVASRALMWPAASAKSPEVLAETARTMLTRLGYADAAGDRAFGFEIDREQLRYVRIHDRVRSHWNQRQPVVERFWYRESPQPLETWRFPFEYGNASRTGPADPPVTLPGMALVRLDQTQHLTSMVVVPPAANESAAATAQDWNALLIAAGFDPPAWRRIASDRNPPVYADARAAWAGTWPGRPDLPVRLEAAVLGGKLVYFEAIFPWTPPPRAVPTLLTGAERGTLVAIFVSLAVLIGGAAMVALRNIRAGRGDRRGALRLAALVFASMSASWVFGERHIATLWEIALMLEAVSLALLVAAFSWMGYLAVEPFLRRRWPDIMVTWARVVAGEFRDPLVGRDLLIGCASGCVLATVGIGTLLVPGTLGLAPDLVPADFLGLAYRVQDAIPILVWRVAQAVLAGLAGMFFLLVLRLTLRSRPAAVIVFAAIVALFSATASEHHALAFGAAFVWNVAFALLVVYIGLLAGVVAFYVSGLFIFFPMTSDLRAWYAGAGVTVLLVIAAAALFGFATALGGRPALGALRLED